ncbi:MAG: hypothetical protein M3405_13140 [Acidobacteriota bacterium]|jgi:hypothetical protein|nr:hypothetical protein [Acidobacteriota bacterium]
MPNQIKKTDKIKESEVEESLISDLSFTKSLLSLANDPKLIARQLSVSKEDRLDLLLSCGDVLILVELKITKYFSAHKKQILGYKAQVEQLQTKKELPFGIVKPYLLVIDSSKNEDKECEESGIVLVKYSPELVLKNYYQNLFKSTQFLRVKPKDYGVFTLGTINRTLIELQKGVVKRKDIAKNVELSENTIRLHLQTAIEFGLVRQHNHNYFLTDMGDKFVGLGHQGKLQNKISEGQAEILKQYVAKFPFISSMVFGIYAIVESAFLLARNSYPVEFRSLRETFMTVAGKTLDWKQDRSKTTATYTFLNFAIDLGLLGKIGDMVVITPSGFKFILMLQLYKSIEMIDSLHNS